MNNSLSENKIFKFFGCSTVRELLSRFSCIALSAYALYYGFVGGIEGFRLRITHLFIAVICVLLTYPLKKKSDNVELEQAAEESGVQLNESSQKAKEKKLNKFFNSKAFGVICDIIDVILIAGTIACFMYLLTHYDWLTSRMAFVGKLAPIVLVLGSLLVFLILLITRRTVGPILELVAVIFILYWFTGKYLPGMLHHSGLSFKMFIDLSYLSTDGIFGTSIGASAQYIVLFVIFGSLLDQAGLGKMMMDFCLGVFGKKRGGPALVAVLGSAFVGTFSGSAAANVLTTGSVSIPLMRSIGFEKDMAGGVEAAASTGGMIMPPVMGAIAFLMAEFLGVRYIQICAWALLPAILYFLSIGIQVYLHAQKMKDISLLTDDQIPDWKKTCGIYWMALLPLVVLLVLLIQGYPVQRAVSRAIIAAFVVCMIKKVTRYNIKTFVGMLAKSAKSALSIISACACAGIIVGVVNVTGLGNRLNITLLSFAGSSVFLALLLTAVSAIILGMGMPAAASYIVQYATVIPSLIALLTRCGFPEAKICAHMFCLYYCNLSAITPPVALAAYAGASISGGNPMKIGFNACRLALTAFIVPFMFVYSPSLLLIGSTGEIILTAITAIIGVIGMGMGLEGYALTELNIIFRLIAFAGGMLMILPGVITDIIGIALLAAVILFSYSKKKALLKNA